MIYKPYKHQEETIHLLWANTRVFDASTMGCGKTFTQIIDISERLKKDPTQKILILAPKSLLYTVWKEDFAKFAPHVTVSVATAPAAKREEAFQREAQVYVTNIDAVKWLAAKPKMFFKRFQIIVIDESTSIKNYSARTKAALKIRHYFDVRRCLSGTVTAGPVTDMFYQYLFLDDGFHLGQSFGKFQNAFMYFEQSGKHHLQGKWHNKKDKEKLLAYMVKDITIRHVLEEVIDMPSQIIIRHKYTPNRKVRLAYDTMKRQASVQLASGQVDAINAASLTAKLLQIASGAVYDQNGKAHIVDTQRYDLTLDLCEQEQHTVVFYNWTSQREFMMAEAAKRKLAATFIDGSVPVKRRGEIVANFQQGAFRVIFLQLKAASHGITLTKAFTTLWAGPSYLADYYEQANARVFRIGQKHRTQIINIEAVGTLDGKVYKALNDKLTSMEILAEALAEDEGDY